MSRIRLKIIMAMILVFSACEMDQEEHEQSDHINGQIVDVDHTAVERQSIGNCWVYANASWAESMHLRATKEHFDISQSYWTYMDWFIRMPTVGFDGKNDDEREMSTGGLFSYAQNIIRGYGLMREIDFIKADTLSEMSSRQAAAEKAINKELRTGGRLFKKEARQNKVLVRQVLDEAWQLDDTMRAELTRIFGETLASRFGSTDDARVAGSTIIHPKKFAVYYNKKQRTLLDAVNNWAVVNYGSHNAAYVLKRVKKALHDNEPVFVSWMVDFNALEYDSRSAFYGSFNMETLVEKGAFGRTGGHMTVLEDYQAIIKNADGTETVLKAGVTLDPKKASDKALLDKALENSARIVFFRTKNSWGGEGRTGLPYAPGPYSQKGSYEKGYHDLYMTYLDAPFATVDNCPDFIGSPDCATYASKALQSFVLPPEFFTDGDPEEEDTDDTTGDDTDSGDDQSDPNNLIANGGFEKGPVTTGWTTIDNGIALAETTDANTGLYAAEVTVNTPDQANTDMRQIVSVIAGKTYIISVAVKNSSRSVRARLVVGASYGSYSSLANEQWQVFSYSYKAIATGNIEVGLRFYDDAGFKTGDRVIVDSFSMTIEP